MTTHQRTVTAYRALSPEVRTTFQQLSRPSHPLCNVPDAVGSPRGRAAPSLQVGEVGLGTTVTNLEAQQTLNRELDALKTDIANLRANVDRLAESIYSAGQRRDTGRQLSDFLPQLGDLATSGSQLHS